MMHLSLIWLVLVPLLAAGILFCLSGMAHLRLKQAACACALFPVFFLLFNENTPLEWQWLPFLGAKFQLQIDPLSLPFLWLTALLIPLALLAAPSTSLQSPGLFYGLILLSEGFLMGFFTARDLLLFVLFWEAMLLPLYVLIGIWGGERRQDAVYKFLTYMVAGSICMLAALLALYFQDHALKGQAVFDLQLLRGLAPFPKWIGIAFLAAFLIKTPLFPFHGWLADVYEQAPLSGTILLASILSKVGIYGILRVGTGLFGDLLQEWRALLVGLSLAGAIYGAFTAWGSRDFKRLLAYSSFSHLNFLLAGLFIWTHTGLTGAVIQVITHSVTIAALFLLSGWLSMRIGTSSMGSVYGVAELFPRLCWLTLFFILSAVALPGTGTFVGEFLILFGLFSISPWLAFAASLTLILSVIYLLGWLEKVYFGPSNISKGVLGDIGFKEIVILVPFGLILLWIGIYPSPFILEIEKNIPKQVKEFAYE